MDIDEIVEGYCTAALWADAIPLDMGDDGDTGGMESTHTVDPSSVKKIGERIEQWALANHDQITLYGALMLDRLAGAEWTVWEQCGHDLRLTAGGHGVGFWDRGLPESLGDYLTEQARAFGNPELFEVRDSVCAFNI